MRFIGKTFLLLLVSSLLGSPLLAQVIFSDSLPGMPSRNRETHGQVIQVKKRLEQLIRGRLTYSVDSLLQTSRQLSYLPGQVVALCQLAAVRLQQQQSAQASSLLDEAQSTAAQIRSVSDAGWALQQLGLIQRQNPGEYNRFTPVFTALTKAMSLGSPLDDEQNFRFNRHRPGEPGDNVGRGSDAIPGVPDAMIPFVKSFGAGNRRMTFKPNFTDRWLDSLLKAHTNTSPVGRQLTAQRKLRDTTQQLSRTYAQKGDYAKAYNYFLQYTAYKDSLAAEVTARQVALLQYKQNTQKKEAQIKLLTRERQLRTQEANQQKLIALGLAGLVLLLVASSITLIRANRQRRQANQQLSQQKADLEEALSELKTTQSQLVQSEKMAALGELTAGIAHEIQNPLNFVNNFSEVSTELVDELVVEEQKAESDPELKTELLADLRQNLQKISQHGSRASAIVKGMLEHSRSVTGEKQPTDLNELTNEYLSLAYHAVRAKDDTFEVKLSTHFTPDVGETYVVHQEIGRVLLNLFGNAFYALRKKRQNSPPDYVPTLTVSTSCSDQTIQLTIRDNGTGIPAAVQPKIFQPFFTTKPTGEGTGLGLSLSYDIITKSYGGTLTVASDGATFTEFTVGLPRTVLAGEKG